MSASERTPLRASADAPPDVEDAALERELGKSDRVASRLRAAVRAPAIAIASVALLCVLVAAYAMSDRFSAFVDATRTVRGERVFDDERSTLSRAGACDAAFSAPIVVERVSERFVGESLSASETLGRVYERAEGGRCEATASAAARTSCVDSDAIEACARDLGVVLVGRSIRDRYVLATVIARAKRSGDASMAFVDARASAAGALGAADRRALGVLIDSDRWNAVRLAYDATIALTKDDAELDSACPHRCKCAFADGKLCELRSDECELGDDAFFILRAEAYDDVLKALPHAGNGGSALRSVFPQWIVVDTPFISRSRRRAPSLGSLPHACAETVSGNATSTAQ